MTAVLQRDAYKAQQPTCTATCLSKQQQAVVDKIGSMHLASDSCLRWCFVSSKSRPVSRMQSHTFKTNKVIWWMHSHPFETKACSGWQLSLLYGRIRHSSGAVWHGMWYSMTSMRGLTNPLPVRTPPALEVRRFHCPYIHPISRGEHPMSPAGTSSLGPVNQFGNCQVKSHVTNSGLWWGACHSAMR